MKSFVINLLALLGTLALVLIGTVGVSYAVLMAKYYM